MPAFAPTWVLIFLYFRRFTSFSTHFQMSEDEERGRGTSKLKYRLAAATSAIFPCNSRGKEALVGIITPNSTKLRHSPINVTGDENGNKQLPNNEGLT